MWTCVCSLAVLSKDSQGLKALQLHGPVEALQALDQEQVSTTAAGLCVEVKLPINLGDIQEGWVAGS